ncbi:uncharacterized protein FIESC28_08257 [Fusarium coffeatum]|uniref:Uncharacterized protein n=1 Tax=Fusarium coffeatum TaxID=231269 RepID=A0A366R805_9HYPO|nr:uncharacterized protein FIESC28_08257 [Fusarium coffeatum]RBR13291.1 hypothetical protein FIESC28_08257 [Fusarium coffeatum]
MLPRDTSAEDFIGKVPPYAILSHTWGDRETTLQEFQNRTYRKGSREIAKIFATCRQARSQGLDYAWVDTCSIDKTSSTELGEAINSMFKWYRDAAVCYAFLEDISTKQPAEPKRRWRSTSGGFGLTNSRWFTRGWTLQELIAPRNMEFYDKDWNLIGEKQDMVSELRNTTGIDTFVLQGGPLEQTSREEDIAYSLLGIFGVNMPLLYGEGARSFLRLQEEILKQSADQTLFAWRSTATGADKEEARGLFAHSPREFQNFLDRGERSIERSEQAKDNLMRLWDSRAPREPWTVSNRGIRVTGRIQDLRPNYERYHTVILLLNCCFGGNPGRVVGIYLRRLDGDRYARIRPGELASVKPLRSIISPYSLYGLRHGDEVRGHYYDQPWTSSYTIRRELEELEHSKFENSQAAKERYEHGFYISAKGLKPTTIFGQYKLHGVMMTDARGLLRFFSFYPDDRHMDIVLKTYPNFRVVLLYKATTSSDLILVLLGRKVQPDESGGQHWVTATYLSRWELEEKSTSRRDSDVETAGYWTMANIVLAICLSTNKAIPN